MKVRTVSVICPLFNEEKFIERCIMSILEQDYPQDKLEVLFIDGRSTDLTADIVRSYTKQYPFIKLLDNPERNYISELVRYLYELGADNVGGVWNTQPAKDTAVCHAIALASSHPFGVGGSMHKIGASKIMETDTVPFGCYKREVFEKTGKFDTDLVRNQDDEFNGRLQNLGGKIFLIPQVIINYTARDTIRKMRHMYYQYGLYKPLVNKKLGSPATIRQFFPLVFLLGLLFGAIASCFSPLILKLYTAVLLLYLFIGLVVGAMGAIRTRRLAVMPLMPYIFLNIHLSYGFGYLRGIFKVCGNRKYNVKSNR